MWDVFARLRLIALGLGVLAAGSVVEASVISFKAVKKNGVAVPGGPTNNLTVLGGDTIEVEFFLSNWINDFLADGVPNNVRIFEMKLNREGFVSPDPVFGNGSVKPLGWCGPVDRINCANSSTCPAEYPICLTSPPTGCTCSPHDPTLGAAMDTLRSDFLFMTPQGLMDVLYDTVTSNIDYRYWGMATESSVPDRIPSVPRYLGTLFLKVSANACGTFTFGFVRNISDTFIADPSPDPIRSLPDLQPLLLTVSDCSRQLLSCSPGHCNIDARIPHDRLNATALRNTNQMVMTFSKLTVYCSNATTQSCLINSDCPPGGTCIKMTAADFEVTVVPFDPINDILPVISALTPGADRKITTVSLNRRIQQTRWTCIRDKGSNKRCCMGSLPADADNSRISKPDDIFEVLDNLEGIVSPALASEKCDTDRSLRCTGADLLMVGDLLNGADAFIEVWGDSLPTCPDMRLPP